MATTDAQGPATATPPPTTTTSTSPDAPLASTAQKVWLFLALLLLSAGTLCGWFRVLDETDKKLDAVYEVHWERPAGLSLAAGPATFWYDARSHRLQHRGTIDTEGMQTLVKLASLSDPKADPKTEGPKLQGYVDAVNELAFLSGATKSQAFHWILLLGGLSGILGVMVRSLSNFVGVACFKRDLRLGTWWPWYAVRPVIGMIVGVLTIVLVHSKLLFTTEANGSGTLWWLSVSFLAGYGATEFTERLRLVTQTLFGSGKN
jgi:hypothetical protein